MTRDEGFSLHNCQASSFSPAVFYAVSPLRQDFPQGQNQFDRPEAKRGLTEARVGMTGTTRTTLLGIDGWVVFKRKDWAKMPLSARQDRARNSRLSSPGRSPGGDSDPTLPHIES